MKRTHLRIQRSIEAAAFVLSIATMAMLSLPSPGHGQEMKTIKLNGPDKKRGLPFMETLSVKASAREWSARELSLQDLSDLLWAANGINRPEEKKYTASSAQNAHDVDLYLFMKDGVYLYDADLHVLNQILEGDHRSELMMMPPPPPAGNSGKAQAPRPALSDAPIQIMLISDSARFRGGLPELRYEWGAIDAGIVSQNISLFCAATGLKTRPRASMDKETMKTLLHLKDTQYVLLNHPVGYAK